MIISLVDFDTRSACLLNQLENTATIELDHAAIVTVLPPDMIGVLSYVGTIYYDYSQKQTK